MDNPQRVLTDQELLRNKEFRELTLRYRCYTDPFYKYYFLFFVLHAVFVLVNYLLIQNDSNFMFSMNGIGFAIIIIELVYFVNKLKRSNNSGIQIEAILLALTFLFFQFIVFLISGMIFLIMLFLDPNQFNNSDI